MESTGRGNGNDLGINLQGVVGYSRMVRNFGCGGLGFDRQLEVTEDGGALG